MLKFFGYKSPEKNGHVENDNCVSFNIGGMNPGSTSSSLSMSCWPKSTHTVFLNTVQWSTSVPSMSSFFTLCVRVTLTLTCPEDEGDGAIGTINCL